MAGADGALFSHTAPYRDIHTHAHIIFKHTYVNITHAYVNILKCTEREISLTRKLMP